jgi:hypothetical protein
VDMGDASDLVGLLPKSAAMVSHRPPFREGEEEL